MGYNITNQYGAILVNDEATINEPKEIRFITPNYETLFKIPDGDHVLVKYKSGEIMEYSCKFLDPYHFLLGNNCYHICEFAERMEAIGARVCLFPEKRIIWSNRDIDEEAWKKDLRGEYPDIDDRELERMVYEQNDSYLDDERINLDINVGSEILVIADIGLWDGRRMGYQIIESGNISDCLYASKDCDYNEWYVDRDGEFRSTQSHHDGTHYLTYRKWKDGTGEDDREKLLNNIYHGIATREEIDAVTDKLGADIGKVYGWDFPDKRLKERSKDGKER